MATVYLIVLLIMVFMTTCLLLAMPVREQKENTHQGWRKQICIGQAKNNISWRFYSKPMNCLSFYLTIINFYS